MIQPLLGAFDWKFSLGDVITIVSVIVAMIVWIVSVAMLWQRINDRLQSTSEETKKNTKEIDDLMRQALNITLQQHERRIKDLEEAIGQIGKMEATLSIISKQFSLMLERQLDQIK